MLWRFACIYVCIFTLIYTKHRLRIHTQYYVTNTHKWIDTHTDTHALKDT